MSQTTLQGPFDLTADGVKKALTARMAGVYAVGHTDPERGFTMERVGRSDADVKGEIAHYLACYNQFAFEYCLSAKSAFEKECDLFHNGLGVRSYDHPKRLDGSYWKCPFCNLLA